MVDFKQVKNTLVKFKKRDRYVNNIRNFGLSKFDLLVAPVGSLFGWTRVPSATEIKKMKYVINKYCSNGFRKRRIDLNHNFKAYTPSILCTFPTVYMTSR